MTIKNTQDSGQPAIPPLPASAGSAMARKLRVAQDYLQNAVSGLAHHIHETSPIMRDIVAADRNMEEVRQWLLSLNEKVRHGE